MKLSTRMGYMPVEELRTVLYKMGGNPDRFISNEVEGFILISKGVDCVNGLKLMFEERCFEVGLKRDLDTLDVRYQED